MSDRSTAHRDEAYRCFAQGDFPAALTQLQLLQEHGGLDAQTANDLGVVLFKLGRSEEALARFREAQLLAGETDNVLVGNLMDAVENLMRTPAVPAATPSPSADAPRPAQSGLAVSPVADATLLEWQEDSAHALHHAARALSDEQWAQALYDSVRGKRFGNHLLPGFINEDAQRMFVGSAGQAALEEAYRFIQVVLRHAREQGLVWGADSVALDFGSGWGRYTRFMLKYVHPDNLYGLEVNGGMVEHCRKAFGMANFLKVGTFPPSPLRDGIADIVFGYSVFSHLAPPCANAWIGEFARLLKPGGLVLMTTQGRSFIQFCKQIRDSGDRSHEWFISLANSFVDEDAAYRDYDEGGFLHSGYGQYDGTYGESLISRGYIEQHWSRHFDLVEFVDDRNVLPQALFVLKRNREPAP